MIQYNQFYNDLRLQLVLAGVPLDKAEKQAREAADILTGEGPKSLSMYKHSDTFKKLKGEYQEKVSSEMGENENSN